MLVVFTGVGAKKRWLDIARNIWSGPIDVCISTGLAGALRESIAWVKSSRRVRSTISLEHETRLRRGIVDLAKSCGAEAVPALLTVDRVVWSRGKAGTGAKPAILWIWKPPKCSCRPRAGRSCSLCSRRQRLLLRRFAARFQSSGHGRGRRQPAPRSGRTRAPPKRAAGFGALGRQSHAAAEALACSSIVTCKAWREFTPAKSPRRLPRDERCKFDSK